MASLGQLAAGVAHEINSPIAQARSNINALAGHLQDLLRISNRCAAPDRP
jgi:C4-dicarboxylate-specific signal transduction histidine kinase